LKYNFEFVHHSQEQVEVEDGQAVKTSLFVGVRNRDHFENDDQLWNDKRFVHDKLLKVLSECLEIENIQNKDVALLK
jgi:hypothetical protein